MTAPANINLLHVLSKAEHNDAWQLDLHHKFTASSKEVGPGLRCTVIFDHCIGRCLFPVQFVTEW